MSQPTLDSVISWCQDWFYRKPQSLQERVKALEKRVDALEKAQNPAAFQEQIAKLKSSGDALLAAEQTQS